MKNYIKIICSIIIVTFFGCDKEVKFITSHPFVLSENHNSFSSIDLGERTLFEITPEGIIENLEYQFSYIVTEGEGFYIDQNGEKLLENFSYSFTDLVFSYDFIGETEGTVRTNVTVTDGQNTDDIIINYDVIDRAFDFTATSALTNIELGKTVSINYNITEIDSAIEDSYTLKYTSTENGTFSIDGQQYEAGTVIFLENLDFTAIYESNVIGEHIITSEITAVSNNESIERETKITYEASEFTLNVISDEELTVGDTIPIEFTLNETSGLSTFDIEYTITGVEQELQNENGFVLEKDISYDVESNIFKWNLTAIEEGSTTINFIVTNQFGITDNVEITYTISPIQFDFTVIPNTTTFNTDESISFAINMDAPDSLTYTMSISSNANAIITYLTDYSLDQSFTVPNIDFSLFYNSSSAGSNVITFTITGSNGVVKTKTLTIGFLKATVLEGFTATYEIIRFSGVNSGTVFYEQELTFDFTLDATISISSLNLTVDGVTKTLNSYRENTSNQFVIKYDNRTSSGIISDVDSPLFNSSSSNIEITVTDSAGNISNSLAAELTNIETVTTPFSVTTTSNVTVINN